MNELELFNRKKIKSIEQMTKDKDVTQIGIDFINCTAKYKYSYNFTWLGRPIIQFPQDIIAMQEIIWEVKPDLIIETGIAHGGSIIFNASMLELLDQFDKKKSKNCSKKRMVLGIDINIREHNKIEIEKHPLYHRIKMIQGSSIDKAIINHVHDFASDFNKIMVFLDSNHTHDHVLAELLAYARLVSVGSYCVVFDTVIEDMPAGSFPDRPWDKDNNPKTALWEFLKQVNSGMVKDSEGKAIIFKIDSAIHNKLLITVAPDGYLKRIN